MFSRGQRKYNIPCIGCEIFIGGLKLFPRGGGGEVFIFCCGVCECCGEGWLVRGGLLIDGGRSLDECLLAINFFFPHILQLDADMEFTIVQCTLEKKKLKEWKKMSKV